MNVVANGTRGVRATKARVPKAVRHRNVRLSGSADVDRTIGQLRHRREASLERTAAPLEYLFHVGSQWVRVHRRDKDGVRYDRGIRDTAEGSPAERRPFSGLEEKGLYLFSRRAAGALFRERVEAHLIGCTDTARAIDPRELDHHGLESAALAAMDGSHFARTGRRKTDTGRLLVLKKELPPANFVADRHVHRWAQAGVVGGEKSYMARRIMIMDAGLRLSEDRKIQALLRYVNGHDPACAFTDDTRNVGPLQALIESCPRFRHIL